MLVPYTLMVSSDKATTISPFHDQMKKSLITLLSSFAIVAGQCASGQMVLTTPSNSGFQPGDSGVVEPNEGVLSDSTVFNVDGSGNVTQTTSGNPVEDWSISGTLPLAAGDSFSFSLTALATDSMVNNSPLLDRNASGFIGIRQAGGNQPGGGNGIDPTEGLQLGFDATALDAGLQLQLISISFREFAGSDAGTITNPLTTDALTFSVATNGQDGSIDVSSLNLFVQGGDSQRQLRAAGKYNRQLAGERIHDRGCARTIHARTVCPFPIAVSSTAPRLKKSETAFCHEPSQRSPSSRKRMGFFRRVTPKRLRISACWVINEMFIRLLFPLALDFPSASPQ